MTAAASFAAGRRATRWRRPGPAAAVLGIGLLAILLMATLTTAVAIRRHRAELSVAARELRTLDVLLAGETSRSLQSVQLVLDNVADAVAAEDVRAPEAFATREATVAVHDALRARAAGLPQLDAITLVATTGKLVNFSRAWPVPAIDLSDRDYFRRARDGPARESFLSEPVLNRGTGTPTVYLVRRIDAPDGTPVGFVLGAINLSTFDRFFASLQLDPGTIIALWRQDGVLLARYPPADAGQRMPPEAITSPIPFADMPGVFEKSWTLNGGAPTARLVASQPVADFGLQINIARPESAILADWRREVTGVGSAVGLAILCVAGLMWALLRVLNAFAAAAAASREREVAVQARDSAEDALRQSQKMEAVGQLTGGVAHDFNNLLTVVRSSVDLLRRPNLTAERRTRYVEAIAEAADRAAKLTGQLLAFARRQALRPEVFDAAANVAALADLVDRLTGSRVSVETALPGTPCPVEADPNQFDTALLNMAVNARDAMPEGGRLVLAVEAAGRIPPLRAHPAVEGDFVAVSVRDTGQGIPPEVMDRVFDPFFTTKKVGQGTGLGLSQVLGFAKQSGGDVTLASEPGLGTTVTLYLPRAAAAPARLATTGPGEAVTAGRALRVLVVEDNAQVARTTVQLLTELGCEPTLTESAEAALAELAAPRPGGFDLVFSDVVMPGLSGLDLGRTLRRSHPGLPVLLTSGYSQAITDHGSDGFAVLEKPYRIDDLARALRVATARAAEPVGPG